MKMKLIVGTLLFIAQISYGADNNQVPDQYQIFLAKDRSGTSDLYVGKYVCGESLEKMVTFAKSCNIDASVKRHTCSCPFNHSPSFIFTGKNDENTNRLMKVFKWYEVMDNNPLLIKRPSEYK